MMIELTVSALVLIILLAMLVGMLGITVVAGRIVGGK